MANQVIAVVIITFIESCIGSVSALVSEQGGVDYGGGGGGVVLVNQRNQPPAFIALLVRRVVEGREGGMISGCKIL